MVDKSLIVEVEAAEGYISYYKNDIFIVDIVLESGKIFEHSLVYDTLFDIINNSKTVIDGGAHVGSHTVLYKSINPDLEVHSFEPQARLFELLEHNVYKNNLSNIYIYNLALANKALDVSMGTSVVEEQTIFNNPSYGIGEGFNLGGLGFGPGGERVKTITIDSLDLQSCDFIKLDLEGAEPLAIIGAMETIKKFNPIILFEHNHHQLSDEYYEIFGVPKVTTFDLLFDLGYTIEALPYDNYLATK